MSLSREGLKLFQRFFPKLVASGSQSIWKLLPFVAHWTKLDTTYYSTSSGRLGFGYIWDRNAKTIERARFVNNLLSKVPSAFLGLKSSSSPLSKPPLIPPVYGDPLLKKVLYCDFHIFNRLLSFSREYT